MMTNIFLTFFQNSVSTSMVIAVLILCTPFINKRYAAKWKYWIWIFLALRLLIPFGGNEIQSMVSRLWRTEEANPIQFVESHTEIPPEQTVLPGKIIFEIPEQMTTPIAVQSEKGSGDITPLDIAAFIWLTGALAFLSVHFISYGYYKNRMLKRGRMITNPHILGQVSELKRELHMKRTVYAIEYPEAASPMIIGFTASFLVLPKEQYGSEELFFILKHELVHLKRRDVYVKLLFVAASAVHWFNPLVWMMRKEAAVDMELSCDERVTQGTNYVVRKAYTETLLSMLRRGCVKRIALSTQFYGGKQIMKKRFRNILIRTGKRNGAVMLICAVILTVSLGTLVGCSAVKINAKEAEDVSGQAQNDDVPMDGHIEKSAEEPVEEIKAEPSDDSQLSASVESPRDGQIYGYISGFDGSQAAIDRQIWATPESEYWKPEYDDAAGFEVVDAEGEDIIYPFREDCAYSVLENHVGPVVELDAEGFENSLREMEYPVLWVIELENGEIKSITEQYRP